MKKALLYALTWALPAAAMAQSPLLTVLNDGAPPSSDVALAMMAGLVDCDPVLALPHALSASGVRFADPAVRIAPPGVHSRAVMVLSPDGADAGRVLRDPRGGVRYARAMYRLRPTVKWPAGISVLRVAEVVEFDRGPHRKPFEILTFTFNVPTQTVVGELDRRYDRRVSAHMGASHRNERVWFEVPADNALQCLRQPDL